MHNLCEVAEKKVSMVLRLRQITYIKVFAFSFLCTLFVIYLHLALPSMFNQFAKTNFFFSDVSTRISEPYGEYVWNLHTTHPVFARRQLTTQVVHLFQHVFDIGIMPAFILLQSLLLFFSGVALFYFIRAVELEKYWFVSLAAFYTTFPILFAFLPSIWSYDDLWQIFFLFLVLANAWNRRYTFTLFFLFLALVSRESTILAFPGIFGIMVYRGYAGVKTKISFRSIFTHGLMLLLPIVVYMLYYVALGRILHMQGSDVAYMTTERFRHVMYNFQNTAYSVESLVAPVLVYGLAVYALFRSLQGGYMKETFFPLVIGFVVTMFVNVLAVYTGGHAYEMRLFFLPLVFLYPLLGFLYMKELRTIRDIVKKHTMHRRAAPILFTYFISFFLCIFATIVFSFFVYSPVGGGPVSMIYQCFLFLVLFFIALSMCLHSVDKSLKRILS
ncbi:MAG: putative membrane protein [Candidatus Magasanikbacteria bacterium GW2011_GWD2_43_18]|uniref:Putative membrane protein n=1 Tax=Candidatus Magasanikbacteria bacterium GW2011_GWE2_42_7 TaxID=1619052 RepID=A0A0G1BCX4_9BACT|nr:MAG: putative membrane protein [Candidatus Magasanikbacteria bacterium GW2011_GWC2_42_27]KKS71137.1 MAG: putative membrane protein [Candidatus Magasanikbacteria bacterium GW2011_GWE2_42_7]KKT04267.1 MAG: putative membrane protein [Candidatus Magasanikbacteria bacterium GW2011_GWD2_43_18]KKT25450.1 MAG: putative membrane protein [Candidatus Magasanikbacteria bacterium GW2011_GWA2_43_9]